MIFKLNSHLKFISFASFIFFNSHAIADECEVIPMLAPPQSTITQPYSGDCKNGKAEGKGSYQFKQTSNDRLVLVQGEFKNGMLNGNGSINFEGALGKSKIEGTYIDNLMNGNGTSSHEKFGTYKNQWKNGRLLYGHEISSLTNGTFVMRLYTNGYLDKTCSDSSKLDDFCTAELKEKLKNKENFTQTANQTEQIKLPPISQSTANETQSFKSSTFEFSLIDDQCSSQTILVKYDSVGELQSSISKLNSISELAYLDAKKYFNAKCDKYIKNRLSAMSRYQIYIVSKTYSGKCSLGQGSDNLDICLRKNGAIAAIGKGQELGSILGIYTWNGFALKEELTRSEKILTELSSKYLGKIYYRGNGYHFNKSILIGVPKSIDLKKSSVAIPIGNEVQKILTDNIIYQDNGYNKQIKYIGIAFDDDIKYCGDIEAIGCIERIIWIGSNIGSSSVIKAVNYEIDEKEKSEKLKVANAIKEKSNEKTKALAKRTNADGWRAAQLKTNVFAHEGKTYLFNTSLLKMETFDTGIFNGDYFFSSIPKNAINSNNQLVIAGKVIGMKSVKTPFGGEISIPHMRYVGHEFCSEKDCNDFGALIK